MRHNILFADENITDEKLDETFGMMYLVSTMPEGADTMIDEQYNLSTGQRQLITIARVMPKDSPILILDEAASSVGTRTEKIIHAALDKLMAGIILFIAHRL